MISNSAGADQSYALDATGNVLKAEIRLEELVPGRTLGVVAKRIVEV